MKEYLDVTVEIEPAPPGADGSTVYRVRITSWDGRKADTLLQLPFKLSDLSGVVFGAAQTSRGVEMSDEEPPGGSVTPKDFGEKLFQALFTGEVKSILDKAIGVADYRQNTGLRIRLSMNLRDTGLSDVASLPWELLRDPTDPATPLVLSNRRLLVRSLDVPLPSEPHPFEKPLRILLLIANPKGTAPLDLDEEKARILKAWGQLQGTELHIVRPVEEEVRTVLASADFHVVHFMGHGEFTGQSGGVLLLEDEHGGQAPVFGDEFAEWLHNELPALRLVVLNACKTGTTTARTGVDPFAGVATSLIRSGIPAVVAMQFPISDRGAIAFADTLYQQIVKGMPVDAAVSEARKQLGPEFATPVLYMRSATGALFTPAVPVPAAPTPPPAAQQLVQSAAARTVTPAPAAIDPWGPGATEALRVFLAGASNDLHPQHATLARQLRDAGVLVVDAAPSSLAADARAAWLDAAIRSADLSVHLLGETAGALPGAGDPLRTAPLEQLRLALTVAHSVMVLILDDIEISTVGDVAYQSFLVSLIERPRDAASFELVRTGRHQLGDEVVAKLKRLRDARQAMATAEVTTGMVRSAFVDAHKVDRTVARQVEDLLVEQNIDVTLKTSTASPTEAVAQFDVNLTTFPLYIVIAGGADKEWVKHRSTAARKTAALQDAQAIIAEFSAGAPGESKLVIRYDGTDDSAAKDALLGQLKRGGA